MKGGVWRGIHLLAIHWLSSATPRFESHPCCQTITATTAVRPANSAGGFWRQAAIRRESKRGRRETPIGLRPPYTTLVVDAAFCATDLWR